ncbi:hypothetical protein JP28_05735 [Gallibacterium anatis]|uniref:Uncharacterized protein n=1 Tax=Gallibacterium anatis 12656/12 TaxID=1195244 RepID=U1GN90_9PAST|nr:hypothetical protein N561_03120 [Gallibacterium anatis 12656/12]KGQ36013.1 hypothetical protein JP34_00565 [Gallibacterium anatis]KGQ44173.1 hypothetical protein JP28_05735 [Gallibacterium anatis]KGQ52650.1 hypothetical protein IO46_06375 [Gallibacterium anatis]KGQ60923.1 hypothetical protein IO45_01615 [Gallibacterium anatis]
MYGNEMISERLHRYNIFCKYNNFLKLKSIIIKYLINITIRFINIIFFESNNMLPLFFLNKKSINGIISNNDEKPILK